MAWALWCGNQVFIVSSDIGSHARHNVLLASSGRCRRDRQAQLRVGVVMFCLRIWSPLVLGTFGLVGLGFLDNL